MKFLAHLLLTFFSLTAISQPTATIIEAHVDNNQGLEIPIEIQLFGEDQTEFIELNTNTNGYLFATIETDLEWFAGIGLILNCNGDAIVAPLVASDIPEVDYTLNFNYCEQDEIFGCTDSSALNYNPLATIDDGSCIYETDCANPLSSLTIDFDSEILGAWAITHQNMGQWVASDTITSSIQTDVLCLEDGCYTLNIYLESQEDSIAFGNVFLTMVNEVLIAEDIATGFVTIDFEVGDGCDDDEIFGCTDSTATNYNPLATIDDGSCEYGDDCTGTEANLLLSNYSNATGFWNISNLDGDIVGSGELEDDFSVEDVCLVDGCYHLNFLEVSSPTDSLGFFTLWIGGDILGANDFILPGESSYDFIVGSGCDEWISGCTDPDAINYNPDAIFDDGSCEYPPVENDLCADAAFIEPGEYIINNNQATNNEGIWGECWGFGSGEGEQTSVWYSFTTPDQPAAIHLEAFGDGTNTLTDTQFGLFLECGGEMIYCDGNSGAGLLSAFHFECGELEPSTDYILMIDGWNGDAGTAILGYEVSFDCDSIVFGCTDPNAINYDPDATEDDGSCIYEECDANQLDLVIETGVWAEEISWNIVQDGVELYGDGIYENDSEYTYELCLEDGCYAFEMFDEYGDGWNGGVFTLSMGDTIIAQGTLDFGGYGSISFGINTEEDCGDDQILGCTDPAAVNYNPNANVDDGSCVYIDSCQVFIESVPLNCSTYEFFAYSPWTDSIEGGVWVINNEIVSDTGSALMYEFSEPGNYSICYSDYTGEGCVNGNTEACFTLFIDPDCFEEDCYDLEYFYIDSCTYEFTLVNLPDSLETVTWIVGSGDIYESGPSFVVNFDTPGVYEICAYPEGSNCPEVCTQIWADGCGNENIWGCTDPDAINYNPDATVDDGSCIYDSDCNGFEGIFGLSSNYEYSGWWEILNTETGEYVIGDTIPADVQYISEFCLEDGCYNIQLNLFSDSEFNALVSVLVGGETIISEFLISGEYNFDFQVGEGCSDEILGCTDPEAINYNPDATVDDGSCEYECEGLSAELIIESGFEINGYWSIVNEETGEFLEYDTIQNSLEFYSICLEDGCYELNLFLEANASATAFVSLSGANEIIIGGEVLAGSYNFNFEIGSGCDGGEVFGCTDPEAVNYNPEATVDDGSCIYEFDCNIGFAIIPDSTGENTIWIVPTFDVDNVVEILWDFGDGTTSTELFPAHEYTGDGPYTLCLTAVLVSEGTTCEATFCAEISGDMLGSGLLASGFNVNVIPNTVLSVDNKQDELQVRLFPNPANSRIHLEYESKTNGAELIRIYDITGKVVDEMQYNVVVGKNTKFIDIEHLPNGVYVLSLRNISNLRFVKSD